MTRYILSFSGGKDSVASWLYLRWELGLDVEPVYAETGHEAPDTYRYLEYLEERLGPITRVQGTMQQLRETLPDSPLTMLSLAQHKGRFPSAMARFCTTELKLVPMKRHLLARRAEEPAARFVMVSGLRREESRRRAQIENARGLDDFMGVERWLPLLDWTAAEVFEAHRRHGVAPNPLYQEGMARVGCFPCIFARKDELLQIARRRPEAFDRLAHMEAVVGRTFFGPDKTAMAYRQGRDPKTGTAIPRADDVRRWATAELPANGLFDDYDAGDDLTAPACSSIYGLCE